MNTTYSFDSGRERDSAPARLIPQLLPEANRAQTAGAGPTYSGVRLALSVRETAAILGVSEKTLRRLIARKLLRASRALRHLLIPTKEIERFLERTTPS